RHWLVAMRREIDDRQPTMAHRDGDAVPSQLVVRVLTSEGREMLVEVLEFCIREAVPATTLAAVRIAWLKEGIAGIIRPSVRQRVAHALDASRLYELLAQTDDAGNAAHICMLFHGSEFGVRALTVHSQSPASIGERPDNRKQALRH